MSARTVAERALGFDCRGEALVGILHEPADAAELGVVVMVGGPQYRAGSHRQFVLLARAIADAGFAVLRFDARGMGDSSGAQRNFEAFGDDIGCAIGALQKQVPAIARVVLWGLCDAASAALLYLDETDDNRVAGLCLVNPWVRTQASLARTHVKHYYLQRVRQREFWGKLLRGQVGGEALNGLLANLRGARRSGAHASAEPPFQARMAAAWAGFDRDILLALSGNDLTAREFIEYAATSPEWSGLLERPRLRRIDFPGADHTLSAPDAQARLQQAMADWLATLATTPAQRRHSTGAEEAHAR